MMSHRVYFVLTVLVLQSSRINNNTAHDVIIERIHDKIQELVDIICEAPSAASALHTCENERHRPKYFTKMDETAVSTEETEGRTK